MIAVLKDIVVGKSGRMNSGLSRWLWVFFLAGSMAGLPRVYAISEGARKVRTDCSKDKVEKGEVCSVGDSDATLDSQYVHSFQIGDQKKEIVVYYTLNSDPMTGHNLNDEDDAVAVADLIEIAWRKFVKYELPSPTRCTTEDGTKQFEVRIYNLKGTLGGRGWPGVSLLDSGIVRNRTNNLGNFTWLIIHELWHAVYGGSGQWILEGLATAIPDHISPDADEHRRRFWDNAKGFLSKPSRGLTKSSYNAGLWWKYFMERFGKVEDEPDRGIDAIKTFIDNDVPKAPLETLRKVIPVLSDNQATFESAFRDFTVANYVKDLPGSSVPEKYRYPDEKQPPGPYDHDDNPNTPAVKLDLDLPMSMASDEASGIKNLPSWASAYYRVRPDSGVSSIQFVFQQSSSSPVIYTTLLIRDGEIIEEKQTNEPHFVRNVVNQSYDEVVVIVTSLSQLVSFRYGVNATDPQLEILDPLEARPTDVGPRGSPGKFLLKLSITDLTHDNVFLPIPGVTVAHLTVTVGDEEATLLSPVSMVQDQYWVVVQAPDQSANGEYDLTVSYAGRSATETNAVRYANQVGAHNMLVIDRSGSMGNQGKMPAAKAAASLYLDSSQFGDHFGVVSFNHDAAVLSHLQQISSSQRNEALIAIDGLLPVGNTSIGDGLLAGLDELIAKGDSNHPWNLVLLSDGHENAEKFISDFRAVYGNRKKEKKDVPAVHAIALGSDADATELQKLASDTGGLFLYAAEPTEAGGSSIPEAVFPGADMPNDLGEYYRLISERIQLHQQSTSIRGQWQGFEEPQHVIRVEPGLKEVVIAVNVNHRLPAHLAFSRLPKLFSPKGDEAPFFAATIHHSVFRIPDPIPGDWVVKLDCPPGLDGDGGCNTEGTYLIEMGVNSPVTMDTFFATPVNQREAGLPMPILVHLTSDDGVITDADVRASVVIPAISGAAGFPPVWTQLKLFDDGQHGDGLANDGIYGNLFHKTRREGSYAVTVTATGTLPFGGSLNTFTRRALQAFRLEPGADQDGDFMPDAWEQHMGLDTMINDSNLDPDCDQLSNFDEFTNGTNPFDSDSDNGGENDKSEVDSDTDPNDASDDSVPSPLDFRVANPPSGDSGEDLDPLEWANVNVLRFEPQEEHRSVTIFRATSPGGIYVPHDVQAVIPGIPNYYRDYYVNVGTPVYYKLRATDQQGHHSVVLGPIQATAKSDPFPPGGRLMIAGGALVTLSRDVLLELLADDDATHVRVGNSHAELDQAPWRELTSTLNWRLPEDLPDDTRASVYAQVRDAAGNISIVFADDIVFSPQPRGLSQALSWADHGPAGPLALPIELNGSRPSCDPRRRVETIEAVFDVPVKLAAGKTFQDTIQITSAAGNPIPPFTAQWTHTPGSPARLMITFDQPLANEDRYTFAFGRGFTTMANGLLAGDTDFELRVLQGDTNANGVVTATDISFVRGRINIPVHPTPFTRRSDVNLSGTLTATDISFVRGRIGSSAP